MPNTHFMLEYFSYIACILLTIGLHDAGCRSTFQLHELARIENQHMHNISSSEKPMQKYTFVYKPKQSDDFSATADVYANGCDNINGSIYISGDTKPSYSGPLYCFPKIANIEEYFRMNAIAYISSDVISFRSGPTLFAYNLNVRTREDHLSDIIEATKTYGPEHEQKIREIFSQIPDQAKPVNGKYYNVSEVYYNDEKSGHFDATIDVYSITKTDFKVSYRIYCWDCLRLGRSRQTLQDAIIFARPNGHLALDGGYAVPHYQIQSFENTLLPALNILNYREEKSD